MGIISFRLIRILFLWISSNFGQAAFIQGALRCGKIIHGLTHRKIWKPAKAFQKWDDRHWAIVNYQYWIKNSNSRKSFSTFRRKMLHACIWNMGFSIQIPCMGSYKGLVHCAQCSMVWGHNICVQSFSKLSMYVWLIHMHGDTGTCSKAYREP